MEGLLKGYYTRGVGWACGMCFRRFLGMGMAKGFGSATDGMCRYTCSCM